MLLGHLRVLFGSVRMLPTLGMVALSVIFRCGAVRLGSVFVMFGRFIMLVSSHREPPRFVSSQLAKNSNVLRWFLDSNDNTIDCLCRCSEQLIGSQNGAESYTSAATIGCSGPAPGGVSAGILSSSISLVTAEIELPTFLTTL
jgi:hypothetical protein